jgi:hypothetical protein
METIPKPGSLTPDEHAAEATNVGMRCKAGIMEKNRGHFHWPLAKPNPNIPYRKTPTSHNCNFGYSMAVPTWIQVVRDVEGEHVNPSSLTSRCFVHHLKQKSWRNNKLVLVWYECDCIFGLWGTPIIE